MTRAQDAAVAVAAGADAVGVVFAASPRQLSVAQAAEVLAGVPAPVARVGVFVDADDDFVAEAVEACGLTAVQFCGSESPRQCSHASVPVLKTLSVGPEFEWSQAAPYRGHVAGFLLDTFVPGQSGGTAKTFAWELAAGPPEGVVVFVAGGLNPDNVGECVRLLRPFAVDVSSGVESAPGIKSAEKIEAFCAAVRAADQEVAGNE